MKKKIIVPETKELIERIAHLTDQLQEAQRDVRYYQGRAEGLEKKAELKIEEQEIMIKDMQRQERAKIEEVRFLRNFIMLLTLPTDKKEELVQLLNNATGYRSY